MDRRRFLAAASGSLALLTGCTALKSDSPTQEPATQESRSRSPTQTRTEASTDSPTRSNTPNTATRTETNTPYNTLFETTPEDDSDGPEFKITATPDPTIEWEEPELVTRDVPSYYPETAAYVRFTTVGSNSIASATISLHWLNSGTIVEETVCGGLFLPGDRDYVCTSTLYSDTEVTDIEVVDFERGWYASSPPAAISHPEHVDVTTDTDRDPPVVSTSAKFRNETTEAHEIEVVIILIREDGTGIAQSEESVTITPGRSFKFDMIWQDPRAENVVAGVPYVYSPRDSL